MEEEGYLKKGLTSSPSWASCLSPLAQPFTMNRSLVGQPSALNSLTSLNHKPFTPCPSHHLDPFDDSLLPNSLSNLSLSDQLLPVSAPTYPSYSAHQSDSVLLASSPAFPFDDPSELGAESSFSQYPLGEFHGFFDSSPVPDETKFDPFAFNKSSVSTYTQCSSYGGGGRAADGKYFVGSSKVGSLAGEGLLKQASDVLSLSMLQNIPQDPMLRSSANGTDFPTSSHILPKNVDLPGNSVASNNKSFSGRIISGNGDIHGLLNAYSNEGHQDKGLGDKGKEIKNAKSVPCKVLDPVVIAKSEARFASNDILDGSVMEHAGTLAAISTKGSSKLLDEDESDLDSPCWKGIQNSTKSPNIVAVSSSTHSIRNESEAGTSLNPRAPQFFPSHSKGSIDYLPNNSVGGVPYFGKCEYSAFDLSYKEKPIVDSYKAGLETHGSTNAAGYQYSNGVNEPGKESAMLKDSKSSSALSPPQMIKPYLVDGFFNSKEVSVKGVDFEGFTDGTMDAANKNPRNLSALAAEYVPHLSSSGVGALSDCSELLQCLTQSLSKCPKTNVAVTVNAIRCLSDLLVENCSNDLDSLNEHEHEMICHIINNLYALIKHRVGEKTPILDLLHTGSLDYCDKSTATYEQSNMEFQVIPRTKDLVVRQELDSRSDHAWRKSYSHAATRKMQDLVPSSKDVGCSERGNSIVPVLRNALKENQWIDEEIRPQVFLNLWLEAEGALCSMKYENYILRMKLQMDGCQAEQR